MTNTETSPRSPVSRVSIDGNKIKYIRESKGLTQLYIATFLGVTADTVSRWENRRYPTVKWENVEKLAQALEVDVDEILDKDTGDVEDEKQSEDVVTPDLKKKYDSKKQYLLATALLLIILILGGIMVGIHKEEAVTITATRFLPKHVPAGQPFPVVVRVASSSENPFSFILQEKLPDNFIILQGLPPIASKDTLNNTVKWISNSQDNPFFLAYLVQAASGSSSGTMTFEGQIKADNTPHSQQEVSGDSVLEISNYHWIDSNSDGIIDDEEILMVYSSAEVLKSLGVDMDNIKRLWSAGGYIWNPEKNEYQVAQ